MQAIKYVVVFAMILGLTLAQSYDESYKITYQGKPMGHSDACIGFGPAYPERTYTIKRVANCDSHLFYLKDDTNGKYIQFTDVYGGCLGVTYPGPLAYFEIINQDGKQCLKAYKHDDIDNRISLKITDWWTTWKYLKPVDDVDVCLPVKFKQNSFTNAFFDQQVSIRQINAIEQTFFEH
ncbi:hypothetical protein BJ944DRAFT_258456, partial [Cunninghamella echinulata]